MYRYSFSVGVHGSSTLPTSNSYQRIIVEFDGPEHQKVASSRAKDIKRDAILKDLGYTVHRIPVEPNTVIDPEALNNILAS